MQNTYLIANSSEDAKKIKKFISKKISKYYIRCVYDLVFVVSVVSLSDENADITKNAITKELNKEGIENFRFEYEIAN